MGLSINDSVYSCVFFFLTGLHFFHLLVSLLLLSLLLCSCGFLSLFKMNFLSLWSFLITGAMFGHRLVYGLWMVRVFTVVWKAATEELSARSWIRAVIPCRVHTVYEWATARKKEIPSLKEEKFHHENIGTMCKGNTCWSFFTNNFWDNSLSNGKKIRYT